METFRGDDLVLLFPPVPNGMDFFRGFDFVIDEPLEIDPERVEAVG